MTDPVFDPTDTYVHIADGPAATLLEVGEDFWDTIASRTDLGDGRLVCAFHFSEDWTSWEVHPAGDEIVILLSGAIDLVLDEPGGERVVPLRDRGACIVPRGVWHTARVHAPSEALHITRGAGTEHRPLGAAR
jgi:mannose-6-phosphate isomerase-like protein (cupin superfamily)